MSGQTSRNALLEEVSFLSARNAQLEEDTAEFPSMKEELQASRKQIEVLLVLLGEKEEELEATMMDMKEIKNMYASHIQELLENIAPVVANSSNDTGNSSPQIPSTSLTPSKSVTNFAGASIVSVKKD